MAAPALLNSPLKREQWAKSVMVDSELNTPFADYFGEGSSVIYKNGNMSGNQGHEISYPGLGRYVSSGFEGDTQIEGKGEKLKIFSEKLRALRLRQAFQGYTRYDLQDFGLTMDAGVNSIREKATDWLRRRKMQYMIDALQGTMTRPLGGEFRTTEVLKFDGTGSGDTFKASFDIDALRDIEKAASTGEGFDSSASASRGPVPSANVGKMHDVWTLFIDPMVYAEMLKNDSFKQVIREADLRGKENRLIAPMIGVLGQLNIVKLPLHFGTTTNNTPINPAAFSDTGGTANTLASGEGLNWEEVGVEHAGLRQYDGNNRWTGQPGFSRTGTRVARCILVGMNALQYGMSMNPWMTMKDSPGEDIPEIYYHMAFALQATKWNPESQGDYSEARIGNRDWSKFAVDVELAKA